MFNKINNKIMQLLLLPLMVVLVRQAHAQQDKSIDQNALIMTELQKNDKAIADNGFQAMYIMTIPAMPGDTIQGNIIQDCNLYSNGNVTAFKADNRYVKDTPVYQSAEHKAYMDIDYDATGNLIVWRNLGKYAISEPARNEARNTLLSIRLSPQGINLGQNEHILYERYPRGSNDCIFELEQFKLTSGIGFSSYINHISTVKKLETGLLHVSANGTYGPTLSGVWDMLIDPDNGYIVRQAEFVSNGSVSPSLTVKNTGSVELGDNSLVVATKGTVAYGAATAEEDAAYWVSIEINSIFEPQHNEYEIVTNENGEHAVITIEPAFVTEIRKVLSKEPVDGNEILDYRVSPPTRIFVGK